MYIIIHITSGLIAVKFHNRQYAVDWMSDNNMLAGEPVMLYRIVKETK